MKYPTLQEVNNADKIQICKWYRFLPSATNIVENTILHVIFTKYRNFGGMTPEISKQIGWKKR